MSLKFNFVKTGKFVPLVLLLLMALVLTIISGCGAVKEPPPDTQKSETEPKEEAPNAQNSPAEKPKTVKIGLQMSTSKTDYAWGTALYRAAQAIDKKYDNVEVRVIDTVPMADQVRNFRDFADGGYDIMIGWGYEFLDSANETAKNYSDKKFIISCSPHPGSEGYAPNLSSSYFTEEEGAYLAGVLAALTTKSKKIGFISGAPVPCVSKSWNAFRLGIFDTDPEIKASIGYVGSWADVAKEREVANSLIDAGNDLIYVLWVGSATADVAEERGIKLIGSHYLREYKPKTVIADFVENVDFALDKLVQEYLNGNLQPKSYQMTMKEGITDLVFNEQLIPSVVPQDVVDKIQKIKQQIINGEVKVPRLVRDLPATWPQKAVPNYEEYLEKEYKNIY